MQTLAEKIDALDLKIARWKTRLRVAFAKVEKLEAQRKRMTTRDPMRVGKMSPAMAKALEVVDANTVKTLADRPRKHVDARREAGEIPPLPIVHHDDLAHMPSNVDKLPAFLDRSNPVVAEEMTAKRKAAEAEARRKMPLSGRAAMDAVKSPPRKRTKSDKA